MREANKTAAFTLVELMIAVAIVGILISLAVPSYVDYTTRTKITEALYLAASAKSSIAEFYISNGTLPSTMNEAGITDANTKYVHSLTYKKVADKKEDGERGHIVITLSEAVGSNAMGKELVVEAYIRQSGAIDWQCKPASQNGVPPHLLPASCRNQ